VATAQAASPPRFPAGSVWHTPITDAALHPQSDALIERLDMLGGWGPVARVSHRMHIDFSFHVRQLAAGETASRFPLVRHAAQGEYYAPDCEAPGTTMPVPADAAFEGQDGLRCDNDCSDDGECGDCHLLVVENRTLYELYNGNFDGKQLDALCLATWNLDAVYPPEGRGEHCTSADAAGFPIAPLLVNADEVAAASTSADGDLGHAIRFILPNARIATQAAVGGDRGRHYGRPASHAGGPSGPSDTVPYGVRMRLRADFDMAGYNPAARAILRTMQRYGIVLADGGNIALTFESDRHTGAKWSELDIRPQTFWVARSNVPMIFKSVLFPEPDGPTIASDSPAASSRFTPCRIEISALLPVRSAAG
jgi:serine/threonine-protein kinase